jgi:tetratricopeptide (TPR) repeat protein
MDAARRGSAQTVQVLIQAGADVNTTDSYGTTPIVIAVGRDQPEMVRVLIAAGAKIEDTKNDLLQTALKAGYFGAAQVLLDAGARVENQKELTLKGQIKQFLHKSDRVAAEDAFRTLKKEFPDADRRDEIFQLGDLYLRQDLYEECINIHKEIINLYPGSSSVLSAYYQIARAYEKMGLEFSMAKAYEDLLSYQVTNDNPSPYEIIDVKSLAEQQLPQYRSRKHN